MIGTDKDTNTIDQYYTDLYINTTDDDFLLGEGESGDLATAISSIWDDMGLRSLASRIITGLFLMFMLGIFYVGGSLSVKMHPSGIVLGILEILLLILLAYIGLLPYWILWVLVFVSALIGMITFVMMSKSSA